jgi:type I restriction enzyme R subunit
LLPVSTKSSSCLEARIGSLTADHEWFMKWRTIEGYELVPLSMAQLQVLVNGVFEKRRFLDLVRHFTVFDNNGAGQIINVLAGYHQFHAVQKALAATLKASGAKGDRRCGVVWHTQGSGKSLTMLFYAGRLIVEPQLENPTIVVVTIWMTSSSAPSRGARTFYVRRQLMQKTARIYGSS